MRNLLLIWGLYLAGLLLLQAASVYGGFGLWFMATAAFSLAVYETLAFASLLGRFRATRALSAERVRAGETVSVRVSVVLTRRGLLPVPWLRVEDGLPPKLAVRADRSQTTILPWGRREAAVTYSIAEPARGAYRLEGVRVTGGDVFGLLTRSVVVPCASDLVVYPQTRAPARWPALEASRMGNRVSHAQSAEDSARIVGTREYASGDRPSLIHWRASARAGTLRSKEFEHYVSNELVFVLDASLDSFGRDPAAFETALSTIGSLAEYAFYARYPFGFYSFARVPASFPIQKGEVALLRVLEYLAYVEADGAEPFADSAFRLSGVPRQSAIALVTGPVSERLLPFAAATRERRLYVEVFSVRTREAAVSAEEAQAMKRLSAFGWSIRVVRSMDDLDTPDPGRARRASRQG